jgi:hypothetical protein
MSPTPPEIHNTLQIGMGEIILTVLGIIAVIVAIQSILTYVTIEWLKRRSAAMEHRDYDYSNQVRLIEFEIEAIQRFCSVIETHFAIQVDVLTMVAARTGIFKELPHLDRENRKLQSQVRKALQEAFLGSRISARRFAAIQELSNLVGDDKSLERMKLIAGLFPNDKSFAFGIDHLEKRLAAYNPTDEGW